MKMAGSKDLSCNFLRFCAVQIRLPGDGPGTLPSGRLRDRGARGV